jgi:SAM-dependent methyltransferase
MAHHPCPWWLGYFLISPIRRWQCDPAKTVAPYVREGMTVLEPGPGMGFFTLELARLVGASGRVVAIDIQPKMLAKLKRRAAKAGLLERVDARLAVRDSMGVKDLKGKVDFALAFAVVHEVGGAERFFKEVAETLKPGALVLFAEPSGHVKASLFERELEAAAQCGLEITDRPTIRHSQTVLLKKV